MSLTMDIMRHFKVLVLFLLVDLQPASTSHFFQRRETRGGGRRRIGRNTFINQEPLVKSPTDFPWYNDADLFGSRNDDTVMLVASDARPKAWPPWPFNLIGSRHRREEEDEPATGQQTRSSSSSYSGVYIMWTFARESARVGLKNLQIVGSQLWFHLPPATPPLLLIAGIPWRHKVVEGSGENAVVAYKTVVPLVSNSFVRNCALAGFGLAIMSWAHSEMHRKRLQAPLPLADPYRDINRAILPPFLPEQIPIEFVPTDEEILVEPPKRSEQSSAANDEEEDEDHVGDLLPPRLRRHWNQFRENAPRPRTLRVSWKEWRRARQLRKRERTNAHRSAIFNELIALQTLKKKAKQRGKQKYSGLSIYYRSQRTTSDDDADENADDENRLGYALVTGASRGIGRAIAVELARWEIPLILVARDADRLTALAYDLEACYGVKCCVLEADLSKPGVAERIYNTTKEAGLKVDILVNNAGFSTHGLVVDTPLKQLHDMLQLNAVSVCTLTHLYGKDMKERRRGRVMMISSVCGAIAGIPTVATYAATKAFENTLAVSMAKEMEPHGVGVTCVMPGAVRDTNFRSRSQAVDALCWKLPFYPRSPPAVAHMAVRAMLQGDTEVMPGWQNRFFLKVMKPALPQRLHNVIAGIFWNPIEVSRFQRRTPQIEVDTEAATPVPKGPAMTIPSFPPNMIHRTGYQVAPRLLKLKSEPTTPDGEIITEMDVDEEVKQEESQSGDNVDEASAEHNEITTGYSSTAGNKSSEKST